jgi:hypothetical protein
MGEKTNKILLLAAAGVLVARGVPAILPPANDLDARLDAAIQAAQATQPDQVLAADDLDGDDSWGLY